MAEAAPTRSPTPSPARSPMRLTTQVAVVTALVATIAVVVTGVLAGSLLRSVAQAEALRILGRQADVVAAAYEDRPLQAGRIVRSLSAQGIDVGVVTTDGKVVPGGTAVAVAVSGREADLAAGADLEYVAEADPDAVGGGAGRESYLVASRDVTDVGIGSAGARRDVASVVVVQERSEALGVGRVLAGRMLIAILVGLAVAVPAGWLLARRLTLPLERTATATRALAAGEREVRVPLEGPAEVVDVAVSVNSLASALSASEGRQREFLLSVSHELRTPLTAVRGFAESIADGVVTGDAAVEAAGTISAEAERLDRLVSDLLDVARLGRDQFPLDLAPVDITGLVSAAADVWRKRCSNVGVELRTEFPGPGDPAVPATVTTDAGRVRQMVDGLMENALRVTPAGAPIVMAVRAESRPGPSVVLEVRDGGPGLTPEDCVVAFERSVLYERYRGVRRVGTGLGLALVGGLAVRLGGEATALGEGPEGGAVLRVRLPA